MPLPNVVVRVREIVPTLIGSQESLAFGHDDHFVDRYNHSNNLDYEHANDSNQLPKNIEAALKANLVVHRMVTSDLVVHTPPRSPAVVKASRYSCNNLDVTNPTTNTIEKLASINESRENDGDSKSNDNISSIVSSDLSEESGKLGYNTQACNTLERLQKGNLVEKPADGALCNLAECKYADV